MILKGYKLSKRIIKDLNSRIAPRQKLAILQVGDNPVSDLYVSKKKEIADELGVNLDHRKFDENISEEELQQEISLLNAEPNIRAILVQMPLPAHIDRVKIAQKIDTQKDVDGFCFILKSQNFKSYPPTVLSIDEILDFYHIKKDDKKIVIIGGGFLVGSPLKSFWERKGLDCIVLEKNTKDYDEKIKDADIIVVATGGNRKFKAENFKSGSTVIDASTVSEDNKIQGDVEWEDWPDKINLAPVPGGIGPITVAMLFRNFYDL